MSNETFDKQNFNKKQTKTVLSSIFIFLVGLISVIIAVLSIMGELSGLLDDITDYDYDELEEIEIEPEKLGTYYAYDSESLLLYTVNFETAAGKNICTMTVSNGMKGKETVTKEEFKVISYSDASKITLNTNFVGDPAIITKNKDGDNSKANVFWLTTEAMFLNSTGLRFSHTEISFADKMYDPKSYYGTYKYSDNNYVTFNKDGTATLVINGEKNEYSYMYVSKQWCEKHTSMLDQDSIILYTPGSSEFKYFYYMEKNKIDLNGDSSARFEKETFSWWE